jgi:ElaB/YqjD/DUF883 family membrane-anchored ribosome-binding protein
MMEQAISESNRTKTKMAEDFKSIVNDADDLLQATAKISGEGFNLARAKFSEKLQTAKASLADAEQLVVNKAKQAVTATDDYVKVTPWASPPVLAY